MNRSSLLNLHLGINADVLTVWMSMLAHQIGVFVCVFYGLSSVCWCGNVYFSKMLDSWAAWKKWKCQATMPLWKSESFTECWTLCSKHYIVWPLLSHDEPKHNSMLKDVLSVTPSQLFESQGPKIHIPNEDCYAGPRSDKKFAWNRCSCVSAKTNDMDRTSIDIDIGTRGTSF